MFNDLIKEAQILNDPKLLPKTGHDIRIIQRDMMFETSLMGFAQCSFLEVITESEVTGQNKKFSDKLKKMLLEMIAWFRRMINKIKGIFGQKVKQAKEDMATALKYLRSVNYKSIQVETYSGINSFDRTLSLMNKATGELESYRINNILDTFLEMGKVKQAGVLIKTYVSKGDYLISGIKGYVPSLTKYNGQELYAIKEDLVGVKKIMTNIDVSKFNDVLHRAEKYKTDLDKIVSEYGSLLKEIETAALATDKTNMLPVQLQHLFSKLTTAVTGFFNRNVNLITSVIVTILNTVDSVTKYMVSHAKKEGMKPFEDVK